VTRFFATNKSSNQCHLTEAILELFLAGEERKKSVAVGWTPGVEQPVKLYKSPFAEKQCTARFLDCKMVAGW
jgi:hypothetical protein